MPELCKPRPPVRGRTAMLTPSGLRRVSSTSHITCASSPSNFGSATFYRVPLPLSIICLCDQPWHGLGLLGLLGLASVGSMHFTSSVSFSHQISCGQRHSGTHFEPGLHGRTHFELSSYQPTSTDSGINPPGRFRERGGWGGLLINLKRHCGTLSQADFLAPLVRTSNFNGVPPSSGQFCIVDC
jgi:hypothetical protein